MKTDIEKQWDFEVNGFTFTVKRNKRKDCFLSFLVNTNGIDRIVPIKSCFLTLKGAKHHAVAMIKMHNSYRN